MLNIWLACAGGMSSSMLVEAMKAAAQKLGIECTIQAISVASVAKFADDMDILLLGPQMSYMQKELKEKYGEQFPVAVINAMDYGMMDGEKVLKAALALVG